MARGNSRAQSETQTFLRQNVNSRLPAPNLPEGHTVEKPSAFIPGGVIGRTAEVNKPPYNDPQKSGVIYVTPYSAENFTSIARGKYATDAQIKDIQNKVRDARKTTLGIGQQRSDVMGVGAVAIPLDAFIKLNADKIALNEKIDAKAAELGGSRDKAKKALGFGEYSPEEKMLSNPVSPYKTPRKQGEPQSKSAAAAEKKMREDAVQRAFERDPKQFMTYRNGQWMIAD